MARKFWHQVVDDAAKDGEFNSGDMDASTDWSVCAVGERATFLGLPTWAAPFGIHRLGITFMTAVHENRASEAKRALARIQTWGAKWTPEYLKRQQRKWA